MESQRHLREAQAVSQAARVSIHTCKNENNKTYFMWIVMLIN